MAESAAYTRLLDVIAHRRPQVALILGSGLGELGERLRDVVAVPFLEVPGLTGTSVAGHRGCLLLGDWAGVPVLAFSGRLHYYEGHPWRQVVQPIHIARALGIATL